MRHWYFWVLAPVMLGSAAIVAFLTEPPTILGRVVAYAFSITLVLATLGLADARRFGWALRWTRWLTASLALLMVAVLYFKARREEAFLRCKHRGYGAYAVRVKRFIPGVW